MSLAIIILPIAIPVEIINGIYQSQLSTETVMLSDLLLPMGISFLAHPIYAIAVIFYVVSRVSGETIGITQLWQLGSKYWFSFIILEIIIGISVMFGLMLFIVPGIIFMIRFCFSEFELLLNNQTPVDAMKISWQSTAEYMWDLLAGFLLITMILYIPLYMLISSLDETSDIYLPVNIFANICYTVLSSFYAIFTYRMYEFSKDSSKAIQ